MPFRCQLLGTGIFGNTYEFIDINIRPSSAKTNLDLVKTWLLTGALTFFVPDSGTVLSASRPLASTTR